MDSQTIDLNGTWQVRSDDFPVSGEAGLARVLRRSNGWIDALVPGEIHLDLIRAGLMAEPLEGNNAPDCRWPETKSWWYRTTFELNNSLSEHSFLDHERQTLVFDGLDLHAEVFVNGTSAGSSANALVPAEFNVKGLLISGRNELVVRLTAGSELALDETPAGQNHPQPVPNSAADGGIPNPAHDGQLQADRQWAGVKWLRKPQFSYGWDWVDPLPNIGIWRGVRLEGRSHAVIHDLRVDTIGRGDTTNHGDATDHGTAGKRGNTTDDGDTAVLQLEATIQNLHPWSERRCVFEVEIEAPNDAEPSDGSEPPDGAAVAIRRRYDISAPPGRHTIRARIEIAHPQWWWPNGMGRQPLYRISAQIKDPTGTVTDARNFYTGLRTVTINRDSLTEGSRFCICVNGEEVFCRGGNIGPQDAILGRVTGDKYRAIVSEARNANMNMIRINGCSIYEDPAFYEACDRSGILVWQDLMFTCTTYPEGNADFVNGARSEVEKVVRLLRHHPSIALWCGNNECQMGFEDWWNPDPEKPLDLGGQKLYDEVFPDICRALDPHRPYWPGSPCGDEDPNGELSGDCHWWHPAFMNEDMNRRIRHEVYDECKSRFVSEYGIIGPCHPDSIKQYLGAEGSTIDFDRSLSEVRSGIAWRRHTNTFEKDTVAAAIHLHYADPDGLTVGEYVLYGQLYQAVTHGNAMEALRFRKNDSADDCQGALIWSYSDGWGETGWSILDYYLRRKPSYYRFRRACTPLKVIIRRPNADNGAFVVRVINDTLQESEISVEYGWWRLDGGEKDTVLRHATVGSNTMLEIGKVSADSANTHEFREWIFAAVMRNMEEVTLDQSVWPLLPHRELAAVQPEISAKAATAVKADDQHTIEISSSVYCHAVHVEDGGREIVSDNWFDLLPAVPVRVEAVNGDAAQRLIDGSLKIDAVPGRRISDGQHKKI